MNFQLARDSYRRAARNDEQIPTDPHAVIAVALAELRQALSALSAASAARLPLPSAPMMRTLAAIYLLQSSLDFDKGGEIAPLLFRVYEYCRQATLGAFRTERDDESAAKLAQAAAFIGEIAEAWSAMNSQAAAKVPEPMAAAY